ncbi:MAG: DUF1934 domain-containing protein [Oscillospiraceae bacterium]|nr:DUF1934 domain-containing protein [Oscillospiraceae bacterium]
MKKTVILSIRGRQAYLEQDPEIIELVTEGTMEYRDGGWDIAYEETNLTGLEGVTTTFRVEPDKIVLTRTGKLNSQMVFAQGVRHESLYQMDFGALMITVCARRILAQLQEDGGMIDLVYDIDIENATAGVVDYHLDIQAK